MDITRFDANNLDNLNDKGHGGNLRRLAASAGCAQEELLDFSANINPFGPPNYIKGVINRHFDKIAHYPDSDCTELIEAIGKKLCVDTQSIIIGNGSSEILYALPRALASSVQRAIVAVPSYIDYVKAFEIAGIPAIRWALDESNDFRPCLSALSRMLQGNEIVILGQPSNPVGVTFDVRELRSLAREFPKTIFVIDEAFIDFVQDCESLVNTGLPNVVVLRSMTKFYAIAGLRLGFAVASPDVTARLRQLMCPWSVNAFAQAAGLAVLDDNSFRKKTLAAVDALRKGLVDRLSEIPGLFVYPGCANYLLVRMDNKAWSASKLAVRLLQDERIAIRVCNNYDGLDDRFFRVAVRQGAQNMALCTAITRILDRAEPIRAVKSAKKPAALMFQGTSSSAGKSILTTALCRILLQDGLRVAPFKAQNMSLNSYVTIDGLEMGRAQVVQAQACRLEPDARMNPVLLKPCSDKGSQVIVRGKPVGNMMVDEYIRYKPQAFKVVKECYDSLAAEFDAIVLEGAGSPAEINLKHHDIVNMEMARLANAAVLLVGDIDRGGVFASFVGTMDLLTEAERSMVAGFVVNRFRGDATLLNSAFDYMLAHTGRKVLGTVPYIHDLGLPQEDSVEFKNSALDFSTSFGRPVELAIIDLPHISNFTDFDALRVEPDVCVRVIRSPRDLNSPHAIIIPGSKNVAKDLEYLRASGLAECILNLAQKQLTEIIGICGGFQMLGNKIIDPHHIESYGDQSTGLRLLDVNTEFAPEKTLMRRTCRHLPSAQVVRGYEIHHGQTRMSGAVPLIENDCGEVIGAARQDGLIWGTYLHGLFDADEFRRWFIDRIRKRHGIEPVGQVCAIYDIEPAFDRLAEIVRKSVDMDQIYRVMNI